MKKSSRIATNGAFVSIGSNSPKGGSVLQEIRRSDGSKVVGLSRDTYDRALSNAKSVLTKK
jgi:hypothetical protein